MNTTTTHILFANSDKAEAEFISDALSQREESRCHITIVSSVADAIGHIGRSPCNVVLLDLALPGYSGVEAIQAVRKHSHDLAIIALTRVSSNELSLEALRAGAQDYLHKETLDSSTLVRALRCAIERVKAQTAFQAEREEREAQLNRAQEESAEYARRLSTLINNLPGVAYRCANDPHWTMEYISDGVEQLTGYPASDFIANRVRSFESVIDPDDSGMVRERTEETLRRNEPYEFQYKIRCSLGEAKWVLEKGRGVRDADGHIIALEGFIQDITERKRAEEELRASQQIIEGVMNAIPVRVFWKDSNLVYMGGNAIFARDAGFTDPTDIIGKDDYQMGWHDQAELYRADDRQVIESGKPKILIEEPQTAPEGNTITLLTSKVPLVDAKGEISGVLGTYIDITERKRAEEALRESELRFQSLAESAPVGIFRTNASGSTTYVNRRWCEISQMDSDEALGDGWLKVVHPDDIASLGATWQQASSAHAPSQVEYRFLRRDGTTAWVVGHAVPQQNARGEFDGYIGTITDITERKRVEEARSDSEKKFRQLFDDAPIGYHEIDNQGRIVEVNRTETEMLGYGVEEMRGRHVWEFLVNGEEFRETIAAKLAGTKPSDQSYERTFRRKDGTELAALLKDRALRNEAGEIAGIRASVQDITERKRTEVKLQQLSTAVEQSPASIVITDVKGNIEYVNPKFEQVTGYTLAEVIGKNPNILKAGGKTQEEYAELWNTILSGKEWRGEFHNVKKNGELYWESASISPIIDPNGTTTHFLAVKEDITQQKLYEETFRQTQKMQSIGTLAGGIAHDFNNILGIIIGHSGLLRENDNTPDKFSRSLSAIDTAAQRGASLVRQILTFARKSEIRFELVRINDIIKELAKLLEETFPKSITFSFQLGRQLSLIDGDATQLHQTLLNLCVNARDAMPHGGTISIATETLSGQAVQRRFPDATMDEYVQVTVHDNGAGMSEEVRKRIFEPFYTTKESGKGTGLGLSVVYGIINEHHGFIDVESKPGEGTAFRMYFPVPGNRLDQIAKKEEEQARARGKNETILVVEDEELLRDAIKNILTSNGYRVLAAIDGVEAVEIFKNETGPIALVLMDFGLPKLSGLDALRRMKGMNPKVKCIVSSGYIDPEIRAEILGLDITSILPKPYLEGDILSLVRNVLDGNEKTGPKD